MSSTIKSAKILTSSSMELEILKKFKGLRVLRKMSVNLIENNLKESIQHHSTSFLAQDWKKSLLTPIET